jgi:hypothetical protein
MNLVMHVRKASGRHIRIAHIHIALPALALIALVAFSLSGCAWTGDGKDVANAIEKTATYKSRAFKGGMAFKASGPDSKDSFSMSFSGAADSSDPANPKMTMSMDAMGSSFTIVAPGDGNVYMATSAGTYGAPVPSSERDKSTIDSAGIYSALGKAIGDFQKSQPIQNADGKPVPTITAKVDRGKICSEVLPAFGDLMSKASAGGNSDAIPGLGDMAGGMSGFCKILLVKDPQVWFGIDNGVLTDVSLHADLAFPGAGPMSFTIDYHEYDQGQPQPSIKKPSGAKMYPSLQSIAPALGQGSSIPSTSPYATSQ